MKPHVSPRIRIRHIFAVAFWVYMIWWCFVIVMSIDTTPIVMM
jgi:hypothetical protein